MAKASDKASVRAQGTKAASEKRQRIMQAAERLFTSRRFHEITMEDVAAEAGIAKGTLYGYFADKDDLFFQTCTSGFDELCDLIADKVPTSDSFSSQLAAVCRNISTFFDHRHQLLRMIQAEEGRMVYCKGGLHERWIQKRKGLILAIGQILGKGVQAGLVRDDIPPEVLANMLLGMLRARARGFVDAPPSVHSYEVVVDFFMNGAGRRK